MYCAASHPTIPTVTPTHPETSGPTPLHPTVSQPPLTQNLHNLILLSLPNPEPHCPLWRDPLTLGPIRPSFPGAPAWPGTPGSPWRREDISQFLAHPSAPHSGGAPHSPAQVQGSALGPRPRRPHIPPYSSSPLYLISLLSIEATGSLNSPLTLKEKRSKKVTS